MSDMCEIVESRRRFETILYFIVYYILLPAYFILGMSGNMTLLLAFRKQAKSDKAYSYQIFLTASKTVEIFCSSMFWFGYKWNAGIEAPGRAWYMNNYVLMFYAAHVGCPLANGFIITSLLFSVAMAADRVFALAKPIAYRKINARRHRVAAATLCVLLGLSSSIFEVERWRVSRGTNQTNTKYIIEFDAAAQSTEHFRILGHLRTALRLSSLTCLIALNVVMVVTFRKNSQKIGTFAGCGNELIRKVADKNLLILTIYQSCMTAFAHIPHSIYFVAAFMSPTFDVCYGPVVAPFADGCICLADALDLFVIVAINKKMRRAVQTVLPCVKDPVAGASTVHNVGTIINVRRAPAPDNRNVN